MCRPPMLLTTLLAVLLAALPVAGKIGVRVEADKTFDFRPIRSWTWAFEEAGEVKMARTKDDDPAAIHRQVDPVVREVVTARLAAKGVTMTDASADLKVAYYLLLSTSNNAQTMGQFLPATAAWGLPPFAAATQSLQVMNHGSLVLDLSAGGKVVWRGVAQADIATDANAKRREALLREAVASLLERYPPKR